jgi:hypothetical protein
MLRYIAPDRLGLQGEFYAISLIFVEITVLVLLLALVLEGDNNETDENVHHEECDNDDVDDVIGGHDGSEIVNGTGVFGVRVDRDVEEATK